MHGDAPRSPITGVPGWESQAEQALLVQLAAGIPEHGLIIEIGGEFGMSASLFCHAAPASAEIITIDLFPGVLLEQHRANLVEAGYADRSAQVVGDSRHYKLAKKTKIDLLFVDGDHSYGGVKADITHFAPHIAVGGVLVFHDAAPPTNPLPHWSHYDVQRAIDEWHDSTHWEELSSVDSVRAFRRLK